MIKPDNYTAQDIIQLPPREIMRTRGSMYFGSYDIDAIYHMIQELLSNSIDEYLAGYGNKISIKIYKDNSIEISDNARGIPCGLTKDGSEALEVAFSVIHGGGKMAGSDAYNSSGGMNGCGTKIVSYTSVFCIATSKRDGYINELKFEDGYIVQKTKVIGKTKETGTIVHFLPDIKLFGEININPEIILKKLKELSYLTKGLIYEFIDERYEKYNNPILVKSTNGLLDYLQDLNKDKEILCKPIYINETDGNLGIELALQYVNDSSTNIKLYTNNIPNRNGSTAFTGFSTSFTKNINSYGKERGLLKGDEKFSGEELKEGMTLIINAKIPEAIFVGQTKEELKDPRARQIAQKVVGDYIKIWLTKNTKEAKAIITKILNTQKALAAAKKAKDRFSKTGSSNRSVKLALGDKFWRCREEDPSKCELYIAEGNSAAGCIAGAREAKTQAILALRGKILNSLKEEDMDKILNPKGTIKDIVIAIGAGMGKDFDAKKIRYHKVILACDADIDGGHIQILLTTLFWKHLRPLVEQGFVYLCQPPLYQLTKGKERKYLYSEKEALTVDFTGWEVKRLKGLGETRPDVFYDTTLNPENRILKQITVEDAKLAELQFNNLMGASVPPRRQFIEDNAHRANIEN